GIDHVARRGRELDRYELGQVADHVAGAVSATRVIEAGLQHLAADWRRVLERVDVVVAERVDPARGVLYPSTDRARRAGAGIARGDPDRDRPCEPGLGVGSVRRSRAEALVASAGLQ